MADENNKKPEAGNDRKEVKWLRPKQAQEYYSMGYKLLDRIARACDAKKKVDGKVILYDIQKIDRYLTTL
jgi:hypothetical protein